jgi:hypothetical protein
VCFVTKSVGVRQFLRVIEVLQPFWLEIVTLPAMED